MYNEKLRLFFKSKGLKQKEAADLLGVSASSLGKYLMGTDNFKPEFITDLIRVFPDIDLQYIFMEGEPLNIANEPGENYGSKPYDVDSELRIIAEKAAEIRNYLAQNCHKD